MENNKIHILIVDDDDRIRDLLKEYLKENNYIISTSENAENAKIKLTHFKFDLIVLDVMMPGQDGYDLTREITRSALEINFFSRKKSRHFRIMCTSAFKLL